MVCHAVFFLNCIYLFIIVGIGKVSFAEIKLMHDGDMGVGISGCSHGCVILPPETPPERLNSLLNFVQVL